MTGRRVDGAYHLSVEDDGRGLPETSGGQSSGLGLRLVQTLADQLQGTLVREAGPGARLTLILRDPLVT